MTRDKKTTRRTFIKYSGCALGAVIVSPAVVPATALGRGGAAAPSDRVAMGFIGMGTMGNGHLFGEAWTYLPEGYIGRSDVQVLAVCDVWREKREKARDRAHRYYEKKFGKDGYKTIDAYNDFRELLTRKDIDAVVIATPIHWHAMMTVLAAQAGKDVYCEKPTAVTIHEAQAMVKAIKANDRVFQAGTQQRSEYDGKFRLACELIRNGRIGKLESIYAYREGGGVMWQEPSRQSEPIPDGFDWDLWLGPAPKIPYQGHSDAHLFGLGGINWGQHHYDIVQWSLDADRTGPVELDVDSDGIAIYKYANGTTVYGRPYKDEKIGETGGGWFIGSAGRIGVDRDNLVSEPADIVKTPIGPNELHLYQSGSHSGNFLDCVKTRKPTICDVETAHRAASVLLLGGIVQRVKRPLKWEPVSERFTNDEEANGMLTMDRREPWLL